MLLLVFILWPLSTFSHAATVQIEGRIFTESGPLERAQTVIFKSFEELANNEPFIISTFSDAQGAYTLQLESGEYYFTARGHKEGKKFSAYHGANPIIIGTENLWVTLLAHEEKPPEYSDGKTSAQGVVTYKGKPVSGAHIAFYTLEAKKFKGFGFLADKGLGFMTAVNENGTFAIPLAANKYVVISRYVEGGNYIRPLQEGDLFCYTPSNPIEIKPGKIARFEVPCHPKADRLSFVKTPKIKVNEYITMDNSIAEAEYGIKGKVTDNSGNPISGIYVIAYLTGNTSTPANEAESISQADAHGNYFIPLNRDGNYGLVARGLLGTEPNPNNPTGLYNSKAPWQGISFRAGQLIENVNISINETDRKLFE